MKFKHLVKYNGEYYPAGADVPVGEKTVGETKKDFSEHMTPPIETVENSYNKTEINRMPTSDLKKLAKKEGIKGTEEMTGADLKKALIEKFGL